MGYFIYNLYGIFHRFHLSLHRHPAGSAKAEGNTTRGYDISLEDIIGDIQYQWGNSLSLSLSRSEKQVQMNCLSAKSNQLCA